MGDRLPVLSYETAIEVDAALADQAVVLPAPAPNPSWGQPGGSADRSLGHLALGEQITRAWQVAIGEGSDATRRLVAGPVAADGRVFTIDVAAEVRAFDMKSGALLWQARIERENENKRIAFGGGVSVEGGRVFATSGYGIAAAFDAQSGRELWRRDLKIPLRGAPSVGEGRVFVMSQDNQLTALNAETGEIAWEALGTVEASGLLGAAPPAISFGTAVVGYSSGEIFAYRIESGRTVWQDVLATTSIRTTAIGSLSDVDAPIVIDRGRVFAIGNGGRIAAIDLATGQRVWEKSLSGVSKPWVAGEYVFVVTLDSELVCLTRADGRVRWVTQLPRWKDEEDKEGAIRWAGPVLASDRLILVGTNGLMISASPYTGRLLSTLPIDARSYIGAIVADGGVYVLTDDGKLSAYR